MNFKYRKWTQVDVLKNLLAVLRILGCFPCRWRNKAGPKIIRTCRVCSTLFNIGLLVIAFCIISENIHTKFVNQDASLNSSLSILITVTWIALSPIFIICLQFNSTLFMKPIRFISKFEYCSQDGTNYIIIGSIIYVFLILTEICIILNQSSNPEYGIVFSLFSVSHSFYTLLMFLASFLTLHVSFANLVQINTFLVDNIINIHKRRECSISKTLLRTIVKNHSSSCSTEGVETNKCSRSQLGVDPPGNEIDNLLKIARSLKMYVEKAATMYDITCKYFEVPVLIFLTLQQFHYVKTVLILTGYSEMLSNKTDTMNYAIIFFLFEFSLVIVVVNAPHQYKKMVRHY